MTENVKWTDVAQAIGSIASAIVSIVGFIIVWRQIKLTNENLKQNNHTAISTINNEIYMYLADNSHLRPYFYEKKELSENDENFQQVLVFCEILADFFEFILIEEDTLDEDLVKPWEYYMKKICRNSPAFKKFIEDHKQQYTETLYNCLTTSDEKTNGKRN